MRNSYIGGKIVGVLYVNTMSYIYCHISFRAGPLFCQMIDKTVNRVA